DGVSQGNANGREFRTAPLWGVGQRIFFLHDGRTSDLHRAILDHASEGSEANTVIANFKLLSPTDKQALLYFLRSLYNSTARPMSADPVAKPAAHSRAESRGSRPSTAAPGERRTLRWSKGDSNCRSPASSPEPAAKRSCIVSHTDNTRPGR